MANRRSISELKRALKRRLMREPNWKISRIAEEFRQFSIASQFFAGDSIANDISQSTAARAYTQADIERAIRAQSERRR